MSKYSGTVNIIDDRGEIVFEKQLLPDQIIEMLLSREVVTGFSASELVAFETGTTPNGKGPKAGGGAVSKKEANAGRASSNGRGCDTCGSKGTRHFKTCPLVSKSVPSNAESEEVSDTKQKQALRDADARLRVKRLVEGKIDADDIKKALKRADFKYSDKEVEEMIAWAQKM